MYYGKEVELCVRASRDICMAGQIDLVCIRGRGWGRVMDYSKELSCT